MSVLIDTRGLSCPQPIILVEKAINEGKFPIEALADTVTSRENVLRLAKRMGCKVEVEEVDDEFKLKISK